MIKMMMMMSQKADAGRWGTVEAVSYSSVSVMRELRESAQPFSNWESVAPCCSSSECGSRQRTAAKKPNFKPRFLLLPGNRGPSRGCRTAAAGAAVALP